jgi:hypothetical protein
MDKGPAAPTPAPGWGIPRICRSVNLSVCRVRAGRCCGTGSPTTGFGHHWRVIGAPQGSASASTELTLSKSASFLICYTALAPAAGADEMRSGVTDEGDETELVLDGRAGGAAAEVLAEGALTALSVAQPPQWCALSPAPFSSFCCLPLSPWLFLHACCSP